MRLVLIGAPGSGKGTQAQLLAEASGARHIATGDLLRAEVDRDTELGRQVAHLLDSGALVPDQTLLDLVLPLVRADQPAALHPGRLPAIVPAGRPVRRAGRPGRTRTGRAAGGAAGRAGATGCCAGPASSTAPTTPRTSSVHRLQVFDSQTSPLIDHYRADGRLSVLPAGGPVPQVAASGWPGCWPVDPVLDESSRRGRRFLAFRPPCGYPEKVGYAASRASGLVSAATPLERGASDATEMRLIHI